MPATVISPQCGFARNKSEAEYPHLWPSGGAWSPCLNSRGGTILQDRSGKANHGTLTTMDPATDWVTSGGYSALDFDGTNDHVNLGNPAALQITGNLTISCWFILKSAADANGKMLVAKDHNTLGRAFTLSVQYDASSYWSPGARSIVLFYINGGSITEGTNVIGGNTALATNTLYHSVVVYNTAGTMSIYLNGVPDDITRSGSSTSIPASTDNVYIARRGYAGYEGYNDCQIFDVAIWSRSLSGGEASQLYRLGPGGWATPRRRRVYASEQAAATFQSAWARNSNTLISPTVV